MASVFLQQILYIFILVYWVHFVYEQDYFANFSTFYRKEERIPVTLSFERQSEVLSSPRHCYG